MNSDSESKVTLLAKLQVEVHAIIRNFPACVSHPLMLRAVFIQDRIGIVDVNEDSPAFLGKVMLRQQPVRRAERNMPNFGGGFCPTPRGNQFVLVPKRSVEKAKVA